MIAKLFFRFRMWLAALALGGWGDVLAEFHEHQACCRPMAHKALERADPTSAAFNAQLTDAYGSAHGCTLAGWRRRLCIYAWVRYELDD